jgi:DDE superfamily endonuclease
LLWRTSRDRDAPRSFPPEQVAHVKAIACELPAKHGRPLSRFSLSEIVAAVLADDTIARIGRTTVWRILHQDGLRPWFHKTWIFPRDPQFRERAGPVLDLYQRRWEGQALGSREFVVSTDEKTSIQARGRIHPTQPPRPRRITKVEHEYVRGGAVAYLAAWDVASGRVHGRCDSTTGIEPFERLVDAVMTQEPYRSAERVFWIADNGSSHRGETARRRLRSAYDNAWLVSLPVHASWLNQVEIWFSLVQRKALTPNDMTSTDEVEERLMKFQDYHNEDPKPFNWKFTKENLNDWLQRHPRILIRT